MERRREIGAMMVAAGSPGSRFTPPPRHSPVTRRRRPRCWPSPRSDGAVTPRRTARRVSPEPASFDSRAAFSIDSLVDRDLSRERRRLQVKQHKGRHGSRVQGSKWVYFSPKEPNGELEGQGLACVACTRVASAAGAAVAPRQKSR